jgi:hypothetical protein
VDPKLDRTDVVPIPRLINLDEYVTNRVLPDDAVRAALKNHAHQRAEFAAVFCGGVLRSPPCLGPRNRPGLRGATAVPTILFILTSLVRVPALRLASRQSHRPPTP